MDGYEERITYKKIKKPHRLKIGTKIRIVLPLITNLSHTFQKSCAENTFVITKTFKSGTLELKAENGSDLWEIAPNVFQDYELEVLKVIRTFIPTEDKMESLIV
jgi:hypothetical protein